MVTIRLQRVGRKNHPEFRVVVIESKKSSVSSKHIEIVGRYNPHTNTAALDGARISEWLKNGAKPSDTVHNLLVSNKIIEGKKRNVLPKNKFASKEGEKSAVAA